MASKTIPEKFLSLLTSGKPLASIATVMPDGSPQVTPVWFDYTNGKIRINTARGRVKAYRAKQVRQIGQRQRTLLVARGRLHRFVDSHQAIDDRELGVQAQMNKTGRHGEHFIDAAGPSGCV